MNTIVNNVKFFRPYHLCVGLCDAGVEPRAGRLVQRLHVRLRAPRGPGQGQGAA